jgi:hypothetical protein
MTDFGVSFERVPLMCDNTSVISVVKNPVFHKRMRHLERRYHFLRDHVEKEDIEMRYIDRERQLADIFTKPHDSSQFSNLQGELVLAIHMAWFEGELVIYLVYFALLCHFLHTHLSHFVSPIILACICVIMLIIVLGRVVMRCKPFCQTMLDNL